MSEASEDTSPPEVSNLTPDDRWYIRRKFANTIWGGLLQEILLRAEGESDNSVPLHKIKSVRETLRKYKEKNNLQRQGTHGAWLMLQVANALNDEFKERELDFRLDPVSFILTKQSN